MVIHRGKDFWKYSLREMREVAADAIDEDTSEYVRLGGVFRVTGEDAHPSFMVVIETSKILCQDTRKGVASDVKRALRRAGYEDFFIVLDGKFI